MDSIGELQEPGPSHPPISAPDTAIDQVEEAITRLKICPKKVLGSLGHLRIEKARIKPLENEASKAGGKANVEAAILAPAQSSNSPKLEDPEYIAVKKLRLDTDTDDDRALAPFAHEVKLLNELSHPSVVKIVGFVEDLEEGIAWIVLSWEKNGNLREFVRSGNWELPERVSLIDDVARGLGYLHGRIPPVCHGDLKSLNILVNSQNRAIITDFGSARTVDSTTGAAFSSEGAAAVINIQHGIATTAPTMESLKAEIAASGDFITMTSPAWTIRWAAPELLEGELPGLASDIWALGWICWEAITGNFPFDEENDLTIVLRITRGDLPAVGDSSQLNQIKALCSLMGDCWSLNANERPTAIRCQQVISLMDQVIPSSSELSQLSTTRSSGLLNALGRIQLRNGVVPEAQKNFQDSFEVARSVGDKRGTAMALYMLGEVNRMRNEYSQAEDLYIQARDTFSQIGNRVGFADSIKGLGDVYRMRNEYSKAEESYNHARDTYSQIGDQVSFAQLLNGLGDLYRLRNEYSKAEESYTQARDICSQMGARVGFANSVGGLGDVYRLRNDYSKAEKLYIQASDAYSQIGDQQGFASSVKGLGDMYHMRNEHSRAMESYIQARDTYSQLGNQLGFAHSVKGLGDVCHLRNEHFKAEESYIQARDTYSQLGNQLGFANSVKGLGHVYRIRKEYSKAEELYIQARNTYSQVGDQLGFAHSVKGLGDVYHMQSKYSKAEELYLEAQAVYRQIGDMRSLANNLWYLGWLHRHQAQYGEAERFVSEASTLYDKLGLKADVARCDYFLTWVRQQVAA